MSAEVTTFVDDHVQHSLQLKLIRSLKYHMTRFIVQEVKALFFVLEIKP